MYHIVFLILLALIFPILSPFSEFVLIALSVFEIIIFSTFLILSSMFPLQTAVLVRNNFEDVDEEPPDIWGDNMICVLLLGVLYFFNRETLLYYMVVQMFAQNLYHQTVLFINNIRK